MSNAREIESLLADCGYPYASARDIMGTTFATVGIDPRETWVNGILENSRYVKLAVRESAGDEVTLERVSGPLKFRKIRAKTAGEAFKRLAASLGKVAHL